MCVLSQIFVGPRSNISKKKVKKNDRNIYLFVRCSYNFFHKDFQRNYYSIFV